MLTLYAVKNREGKWFRRKGYGGYGETWVADFSKARIYSRIGPARATVTFFAGKWPEYGVPSLVALEIEMERVITEESRVEKTLKAKKVREKREEIRAHEYRRQVLGTQIDQATAELERLS